MPKVLRPACPRFFHPNGCPWGNSCYDRHCISQPDKTSFDLVLVVTKVHLERVVAYLHDELRFQASDLDNAGRKRLGSDQKSRLGWFKLRVVKTETKAVEGLCMPGDLALKTADEVAADAAVKSTQYHKDLKEQKASKLERSADDRSTLNESLASKKDKDGKKKKSQQKTIKTKAGRSAFSLLFVVIEPSSSSRGSLLDRNQNGRMRKYRKLDNGEGDKCKRVEAVGGADRDGDPLPGIIPGSRSPGSPATDRQEAAIACLRSDLNIIRPLRRIHAVRGSVATRTEVLKVLMEELQGHHEAARLKSGQQVDNGTLPKSDDSHDRKKHLYFRVRAFPNSLQKYLEEKLNGAAVISSSSTDAVTALLSNKDEGPTLCAMNVSDGILFGSFYLTTDMLYIGKRNAARLGIFDSRRKKGKDGVATLPTLETASASISTNISDINGRVPVSRAGWKLVEVFRRRPFLSPATTTGVDQTFTAIDIGASPGGWSYELASLPACERVYAVDPGELTKPIPENVTHMQERIEQAAPKLVKQGVTIDCVVNDMNASPRMTVESLLALRGIIRDGATVILTFKNFVGGRAKFAKAVDDALQNLEGVLSGMEVMRLFMGGEQEQTVIGKWSREKAQ